MIKKSLLRNLFVNFVIKHIIHVMVYGSIIKYVLLIFCKKPMNKMNQS